MTGRVIFFPLIYLPSQEKLNQLAALQEKLHFEVVQFNNQISKFSMFEQIIRKQNAANMFRSNWKVIKGGKNDETVDSLAVV